MAKKWQYDVFYRVQLEDGIWYRLTKSEAGELLSQLHVISSFVECSGWEEWYSYPHIKESLRKGA